MGRPIYLPQLCFWGDPEASLGIVRRTWRLKGQVATAETNTEWHRKKTEMPFLSPSKLLLIKPPRKPSGRVAWEILLAMNPQAAVSQTEEGKVNLFLRNLNNN